MRAARRIRNDFRDVDGVRGLPTRLAYLPPEKLKKGGTKITSLEHFVKRSHLLMLASSDRR